MALIGEIASTPIRRAVDVLDRRLRRVEGSPWSPVSFMNGWVNYGTPQGNVMFRKENDLVRIRGAMKNGTITDGTVVFVLPPGYRPPTNHNFATESAGAFARFFVTPNGEVTISGASAASFHFSHTFSVTP